MTSNDYAAELTYWSVAELYEAAKPHHYHRVSATLHSRPDWYGFSTMGELDELVARGWETEAPAALDIAADMVQAIESDLTVQSFSSSHDVTGGQVDVAAYLAGEPECMVEFHPAESTRVGRVIRVVVDVAASHGVSTEDIITRGRQVVSLVMVLTHLGYGVEVWASNSTIGRSVKGMKVDVKVLDANDVVDPAMLMFALAHPAMLRALIIPAMHNAPRKLHDALGIGLSYGRPVPLASGMSDGTLTLGGLGTRGVDPNTVTTDALRELGLLA